MLTGTKKPISLFEITSARFHLPATPRLNTFKIASMQVPCSYPQWTKFIHRIKHSILRITADSPQNNQDDSIRPLWEFGTMQCSAVRPETSTLAMLAVGRASGVVDTRRASTWCCLYSNEPRMLHASGAWLDYVDMFANKLQYMSCSVQCN